MRENRSYGSEGGEPQINAAFLPLSMNSKLPLEPSKPTICLQCMFMSHTPSFRVLLQKEQLVFSSAHFITFAGDICECVHGHNYGLRAEVEGQLDENRYVIDFIAFRDSLAGLVKQLDHHMLLPTKHAMILVDEQDDEVTVRFRKKRWVFPREDCMLLPIVNTTAEEIAWWVATQLRAKLFPEVGTRLSMLEIGIDENHGQWGFCRLPWIEYK